MTKKIIGVIGGGRCSTEIAQLAEEVGKGIAENHALLVCGGLTGVMEAACRGAKSKSGTTIGILPGSQKADANPFVDIAIATGLGVARNLIIVRTADAVIAIDGEFGTLSEISFCLKFQVPLIGLKTWSIDPAMVVAESADEAVKKVFELIS
ncbi:MAG: TIGR00725 family protein [bacterium]